MTEPAGGESECMGVRKEIAAALENSRRRKRLMETLLEPEVKECEILEPKEHYHRVDHSYNFQIERIIAGGFQRFQVKVGMIGEHEFDLVPVHETAFAQKMALAVCHSNESNAQRELLGLLELIQKRKRS